MDKDFIQELNQFEKKKAKEEKTVSDLQYKIDNLNAKLSDLKDLRLVIDTEDNKRIKNLLGELARTNATLRQIDVPSVIEVTQQNTIKFEDKTRIVIIGFFMISILSIAGSVWFSNWRIENIKTEVEEQQKINAENSRTNAQIDWLESFFFFQKEKNPKDTQKFMKSNPIPE